MLLHAYAPVLSFLSSNIVITIEHMYVVYHYVPSHHVLVGVLLELSFEARQLPHVSACCLPYTNVEPFLLYNKDFMISLFPVQVS